MGDFDADLAYAKRLYEQSVQSGEPIDEVWEYQDYFHWRLTTWQDVVSTSTADAEGETLGPWNVSLEMSVGDKRQLFAWTGDGFALVYDGFAEV